MNQKTKPYYRLVKEVKPGAVITTKRGGGSKSRPTEYENFKPGDLCLIIENRAYPLEYMLDKAPQILTIT